MRVTPQTVAAGQDEDYVFCHAKEKKKKKKGETLFRWHVRGFAALQLIFRASPTSWAPHLSEEAAVVIFFFFTKTD